MHGLMLSSALATLPVVIPTGPCKRQQARLKATAERIAVINGITIAQALSLMGFEQHFLEANEFK